ncbi:MAG: hypothetical protein V3V99_06500 [candidate division Zixibacteria bacterium]
MSGRVLVLNSFVKGWNILKSLARDGFEVNAGDYRSGAPGLYSNRIKDKSKNLVYPNPKIDEEGFAQSVLEHIQKYKFEIILPVNAAEMMALAKRAADIRERSLFPFENYYKLLLLHDKKYFFEVIAGILDDNLLPRSWSIGDKTPPTSEILDKAGLFDVPYQPMQDYSTPENFLNTVPGLAYPVVVKTRRATSAVGVYRVQNKNELFSACRKLGDEDIIVQENLVGRGVGISSLRWKNPDMITHFGHKRVREYPISGGASTSREPWDIDNHPNTKSLNKLLEKLNWHGVVMFEYKESASKDGALEYKLLEANPRFWGSVPLAIANGVDFPVLLCRAATGMEIPKIINRKSVRARILFSDSLSALQNIIRGRRVGYHLQDYFNFRNLYLDDIDFSDIPATRKNIRQMFSEFFKHGRK